MIKNEFHSDLAIPPGEYLEEVINELGMTKDELARRMNRPAPKLSAIFKGKKAITPSTALQLERVVGVPAHIWTGLEEEYRLTLARQKEKEGQRSEISFLKKYSYNALVKIGAIPKRTKPADKIFELQKFFAVTSLSSVLEIKRYQAAFRCGKPGKSGFSPEALSAWLRLGEIEAQKAKCSSFDKKRLQKALDNLRLMTLKSPKEFLSSMKEILANCGVAMVLCQHLPGTKAHGATFWMNREKATLMVTIRCKWADIFWFSLFHEIGHILLHDQQSVFIEGDCDNPDFKKREEEANQFAADLLISPVDYKIFIKRKKFYPNDIQLFAQSINVDAGIVVGRLQHDGHIRPEWANALRSRYDWII